MKKILFAISIIAVGFSISSLNESPLKNSFGEDPDNCLDNLKVPQLFTPDGDTLDDEFIIDFPCKPESCEISLTDMAGKEVYVTKTSDVSWNGNDKDGLPCDSGIYKWKVKYMYHMRYVERNGQTLLLR